MTIGQLVRLKIIAFFVYISYDMNRSIGQLF